MDSALVPTAVILLMVAVNAFFVAAEFVTVGARKSRVQEIADAGNKTAASLLTILRDSKKLDAYVAGCQVGITLSSLVAGAYGQAQLTPLLAPALGSIGGVIAATVIVLIAVTVLQVVLGELLPKTVALRHPERLAMATLLPMRFSLVVLSPLIVLFNGTAFALMRLEGLYRESAAGGLIDVEERDMLAGALNVSERTVREIMTPRTRMVTLAAGATVEEALAGIADVPHSRFPVTGAAIEDIVGVVHVRELFVAFERDRQTLVEKVSRPPLVVAEMMTVPRFWQTLREHGRRLAIVINEYGTVAGVVTLEDALEEIFGELQDEFDQDQAPVVAQGSDSSVRGDVGLATLADRFDIALPTDRADTIGGLVWHELGRLPLVGDEVRVEGTPWRLKVEAMSGYAVQRVLVRQEARQS